MWARLSADQPETPVALTLAETEQAEKLVHRVTEHFDKNRPALASFPSLAVRVVDLVEHPDVNVHRLVAEISRDPAISAAVLKTANSVFYHRGKDVEDLHTAVMRMGVREVAQIAAAVAGRSLFDTELRAEFQLFRGRWSALHASSLTAAFSASWFSLMHRVGRSDRAFLGGMLQDIGKSMALRSLSSLMVKGHVRARVSDPVVDRVLETVHVRIGADALAAWCLPPYLIEICLRHHDDELPEDPELAEAHLLRVISGLYRLRKDRETGQSGHARKSSALLKLDRRTMAVLFHQIGEFEERVKTILSTSG
ncbi:MAG: HDOD domain-containing protein [Deltaproteobacteria bacterium]|nr:HDOD domain-containing protein [Deltaproteobacteria bacterium]